MLKILQARLQQCANWELPDVQAALEKAEEPEIKLKTSAGSQKKQKNSINTCTSASLTIVKAFDCVDHNKLWKILKEMGIPDHLTCLLRNLCAGKKQQLEPDVEQQTGSKSERSMSRFYIVTLLM